MHILSRLLYLFVFFVVCRLVKNDTPGSLSRRTSSFQEQPLSNVGSSRRNQSWRRLLSRKSNSGAFISRTSSSSGQLEEQESPVPSQDDERERVLPLPERLLPPRTWCEAFRSLVGKKKNSSRIGTSITVITEGDTLIATEVRPNGLHSFDIVVRMAFEILKSEDERPPLCYFRRHNIHQRTGIVIRTSKWVRRGAERSIPPSEVSPDGMLEYPHPSVRPPPIPPTPPRRHGPESPVREVQIKWDSRDVSAADMDDPETCCICYVRRKATVFMPCRCEVCYTCVRMMRINTDNQKLFIKCPWCRSDVRYQLPKELPPQ
ncbi:unnamed protein product [Bemisia tabaci]|uniref:RING-type domain-containing protein n=1 Tax=Bemisia tabaci TaxID=7038 RepID=A0A9P0AGP3_BEMTA|nr:unnamed protein product [Bemisia tabaci]